jgi:hypothetical protein
VIDTLDATPRQAVCPDFPDDSFEIDAFKEALKDLARYAPLALDAARRSDFVELDVMMHKARVAMLAAVQQHIKLPEASAW